MQDAVCDVSVCVLVCQRAFGPAHGRVGQHASCSTVQESSRMALTKEASPWPFRSVPLCGVRCVRSTRCTELYVA